MTKNSKISRALTVFEGKNNSPGVTTVILMHELLIDDILLETENYHYELNILDTCHF